MDVLKYKVPSKYTRKFSWVHNVKDKKALDQVAKA
jgi:hypothetical protein